jgi:N-acetylmuramoyl-L-alanine amidase
MVDSSADQRSNRPGFGLLNTFSMSRLLAVAAGILVCPTLLGAQPTSAARAGTIAYEASAAVASVRTFPLPRPATNVAVHWFGQRTVHVRIAFSRDGVRFGKPRLVLLDELGAGRRAAETYGAVMSARGARAVRVWSDRPLRRLTILALTDRGPPAHPPLRMLAATGQPAVISRAGWGADESLRFDSTGKEIWPPAFYPVQKVIVHHTATQNGDPDPAATIRSIYYYHAVTQGWGDIGYNFLIDEAGNIYEGRYSRQYAPGESPTGQDLNGNGVTAAHAQGYNSGTVGIALLGTLTNQDATPAARSALERLIAWIDSSHGIDPQGSALYTNPVSGLQATFPNLAGHRDVAATECPGGSFYATLPTIRSDVATLIAASAPEFSVSASPSSASTMPGGSVSYSVGVGSANGFTGSVGLAITGLPVGATASFVPATVTAPGSSQLTVATDASIAPGTYPLTVTGTSSSTTHTTAITLVVNAPPTPNFTVTATPASRTVVRGASGSYAISITPSGGFSAPVTLSASGLPTGTSGSFAPNPASDSSVLSVTTTSSAKVGSYTLTITATSGSLVHTTTVSLQIKRK